MGPDEIKWEELPERKPKRPFHDVQSGGLTDAERLRYYIEDLMCGLKRACSKK